MLIARRFPPKQQAAIAELFSDQGRFEALPISDFMSAFATRSLPPVIARATRRAVRQPRPLRSAGDCAVISIAMRELAGGVIEAL